MFGPCLAQQGQRRVRTAPEVQESVVGLARLVDVAAENGRSRNAQLRERIELRDRSFAAVIQDRLELGGGQVGALQPQLGLSSQVGGPELRKRRVIVGFHGFEDGDRAAPLAAPDRADGGDNRQRDALGQRRLGISLLELADESRRFLIRLAQRQHPAGAFERDVVAARPKSVGDLLRRLRALSDDRVGLRVFDGQLRGDLVESALTRHLDAAAELLVRRRDRPSER